jgi:hypothetical protein
MSLFDLMDNESPAVSQPESAPRRATPMGAILVLDVGNVHTRAVLFDMVDGQYRFVARGEAPTTSGPPWHDVSEGVRHALDEIMAATGRQLLDHEHQLIIPEKGEFLGVTLFEATASAGKAIRTVLVGLVPDVSLASGRRAAESTYLQLVDTISLADRRPPEQQIDAIIRSEPDMILIVGGTDDGAVDSLLQQVRTVGLAARLIERQFRPVVLFAGNKNLQDEIREGLGEGIGMRVVTADNVRPKLDVEQLDSAQQKLAALYHAQKSSSAGFADMGSWTKEGIQPTAHGFSRMIGVLGELYKHDVLGIDLGSATTTVAASVGGVTYLNVLPNLGIGHSAREAVALLKPESMVRWLTRDLRHPDELRDYVSNKELFPHTVPSDLFELELEYAIAREIIRRGVAQARLTWRDVRRRGLLPPFGTILLSGSALTRTPHDGWSALIGLDALLPVGVTRLLIDPYNLAVSLGVVVRNNPTAVVQVMDTGAFYDLGSVVSLTGRARKGETVLRGSYKLEGSKEQHPFEVDFGTVVTLPIPQGVQADVSLRPRNMQIETGETRLNVLGGDLGLIIDARGRPWRFPRDAKERHEMLRGWQNALTQYSVQETNR